MPQVSIQTIQEYLGVAGNPLGCPAYRTCSRSIAEQVNHSLSLGNWSKPGHISHPKRYLLLSLRANRDPLDSVDKGRQILQVRKIVFGQHSLALPRCCQLGGWNRAAVSWQNSGCFRSGFCKLAASRGCQGGFHFLLLFIWWTWPAGMVCWSAQRSWRSLETTPAATTWENSSSANPN